MAEHVTTGPGGHQRKLQSDFALAELPNKVLTLVSRITGKRPAVIVCERHEQL